MAKYRGKHSYTGAWGYVLLDILYAIPVIGFICLLVHAFSHNDENRMHYARSYFARFLVALLLLVAMGVTVYLVMDTAEIDSWIEETKDAVTEFVHEKFPDVDLPWETEAAKPTKTPAEQLIGTWTLTAVEGDGDAAAIMSLLAAMNGSIEFTFDGAEMTMVTSMQGTAEEQVASYTISGNRIVSEVSDDMVFSVDGDTLRLTVEGEALVFTRNK